MKTQLYANVNRESDFFTIEAADGVATCLIHYELPESMLDGLLEFIHRCYSPLALVVNITDRDRHTYYISQAGCNFDFEWTSKNLNELEPGHWLQKSPSVIWGNTFLKSETILQTLQASQLPASEVKDCQVDTQDTSQEESRSPLLKWLPLALTSIVSFGLGTLFCGLL